MRVLGFASLALIVVSFICWLASWIYWNLTATQSTIGSVLSTVVRGVSVAGNVFLYLAVLLLAIGVIVGGKRVQQG